MESLLKICWSIEQCSDTKKGHEVSLLTDMSFLKWRYTAKAVYEQEAERIANAALRRQHEFTHKLLCYF